MPSWRVRATVRTLPAGRLRNTPSWIPRDDGRDAMRWPPRPSLGLPNRHSAHPMITALGGPHPHTRYAVRMVRPESWTSPVGASPTRVSTGAPGSRPQSVGETRRSERGVESLQGGSKRAGRSMKRILQPRQRTTREPSRSCHGEGHVRRAPVRGPLAGSLRGMGSGTCAWSGPEQERPVCPAHVGRGPTG